jgi:mannose-6-phosphate isomerase-like protein (cupin superfamily)
MKRACTLIGVLLLGGLTGAWITHALAPRETHTLTTRVMNWDDARSRTDSWGEMRFYYTGETYATKDLLVAVAVVKPGQSVHPAHRHAEEEFLVIAEGTGVWHVDGSESPARKGDMLYVEPWVFHGLVNTGETPLTFFVIRWNGKGVPLPPEPSGDHGR